MEKLKVALGLVLILLLGSQWFVLSHHIVGGIAHPAVDPAHAAHTKERPAPAQPQHSCCEQEGTPSFHEDLCCVGCPALPGLIADFSSYIPYLFLTFVEPHEKNTLFLAPPLRPPTI